MLKYQMRNKKILKAMSWAWTWQVDRTAQQLLNKQFFGTPSLEDQYRLLTLRMWMIKYRVTLEFILSVLVPFWAGKFQSRKRTNDKALGVRIATLSGSVSEKILQTAIKNTYPNGENEISWRAEAQEEYMKVSGTLGSVDNHPENFIEEYVRRCLKVRHQNRKLIESGRFTRRSYRGNPWS